MRASHPLFVALGLSVASLAILPSALAEEKEGKKKKDDTAEDKPAKKKGDRGKDPAGVTGVSPFGEKVAKGYALMAARDWTGAVTEFRAAVAEDPKNPLGHLLLGAAQIEKGEMVEAEASFTSALRAADGDPANKSKALFALSDLRERQKKLEESKGAWGDYSKHVSGNPKAKGYADTPKERQKAADTYLEVEKKAQPVKERIAKREKELKDEQEKDAKKDADANDKKPRK